MREIVSPLSGIRSPFGQRFAFNPFRLFANGEQGAWYDPSDITTLFQDSAGTTPVTAVEQVVGLMLDKSKGLVLGPELITNGNFATDLSGWSNNTGATWSAGSALLSAATASAQLSQSFTTVIGRTYRLNYSFVSGNTGNSIIRVGTTAGGFETSSVGMSAGVGSFSRVFVATGTTTWVTLFVSYPGVSITGQWDNISVRELPGNHAFQTSAANRPTYSARYNLFLKTEQFDDPYWTKTQAGTGIAPVVTANAGIAPNGTMTADRVQFSLAGGTAGADRSILGTSGAAAGIIDGVSRTKYMYIKSYTGSPYVMQMRYNSQTVTITVTDEWKLFSVTSLGSLSDPANTLELRGATSNTADVLVWGADLRVANDLAPFVYQRVNTSTDYDTTGFPPYLAFNGTNRAMVTNNINFTSTDKVSVFAGVRKLSDAAAGTIVELSASSFSNNGAFSVGGPYSIGIGTDSYGSLLRGTQATGSRQNTFVAPVSNVISTEFDIAGASAAVEIAFRINGVSVASGGVGSLGANAGTGNFGNYPLFIGARAGTSLWLNGRLYSLIVRGASSTADEITNTEKYVSNKMGGGYV